MRIKMMVAVAVAAVLASSAIQADESKPRVAGLFTQRLLGYGGLCRV